MALPSSSPYVVVGAGVHGLSTAWHLARELAASGRGDGGDVIVLDKDSIGSGASGIACGVIRNNYFQPAMRELMAHSVDVWESDPEGFAYHPVGYMQISPEAMREDVAQIHAEQHAIGYASTLIEGEGDCSTYMRRMFADWQAQGTTAILHEHRGGYANNLRSVLGLAAKAEGAGVQIRTGTRVVGFDLTDGSVTAVETDRGRIACDHVIVGAGPWVRDLWAMLDLPAGIDVHAQDGTVQRDVPMWTYWMLQEGTLGVDPGTFTDAQGNPPPVMHVDSHAPLYDDEDGSLVTSQPWGIYYKPDVYFGGIQGGTTPIPIERAPESVSVDPYGPASPEFVVGDDFVRLWTSALAHCHKRFEGTRRLYKREPSGGIGAFTPDSFPILDAVRDNCYVIADSNHGYKMIGVGALVAKEVLGEAQTLLAPFRLSRFRSGELHPRSRSPFPWS